MKVEEAISGRRSIRKFKADEIPRQVLREILDTARWAPSWGNTQPWEFYVMTGVPLEEFRTENHRMMVTGKAFSPEVPMPEIWPDHMKKRYGGLGRILLSTMGIAREDKEARNRFYEDMLLFFGAPCLIIACIPRDTRLEYAMLDIGLVLQNICLLAYDKGIGSCIMAAAIGYPDLLRKTIPIPDDRLIIMSVALGYPDDDVPLNHFERDRADLDEIVTWVG